MHVFIAKKKWSFVSSFFTLVVLLALVAGLVTVLRKATPDEMKEGAEQMIATMLAVMGAALLTTAINSLCTNTLVDITAEKETKMKVMQEIYGLSPLMYWMAWASYYGMIALVSIGFIYIFWSLIAPVIVHANVFFSFTVFLASYMQMFSWTLVLSVFANTPAAASRLSSLSGLLLMGLSAGMQVKRDQLPGALWYLAGLIPVSNIMNSITAMLWLEAGYVCNGDGSCSRGLSLDTMTADHICLAANVTCPDNLSIAIAPAATSIAFLLFDMFFYLAVAWWLGQIVPGQYGATKPWNFCLKPDYMCARRNHENESGSECEDGHASGLEIDEMSKVFGEHVAVDRVSLSVRPEEIFGLLGHNGAGKTTLINCIIGLSEPTSGRASINGYDVVKQMTAARGEMSICPQDNPFYKELHVRQHLLFFMGLRGVRQQDAGEKIDEVLSALGLSHKERSLCQTLSGGQQRRLWVATALLADAPFIFLDEPTSGMDPASRRELWELLIRLRDASHSILFTTHYLDEADILADRKAVLAKGSVRAMGTSRELKHQFGLGYHLKLETRPGVPMSYVESIVTRHVPDAILEPQEETRRGEQRERLPTVSYTLPYAQQANFGPLLLELEGAEASALVASSDLSMTSLEEVFMEIGKQAELEDGGHLDSTFEEVPPDDSEGPDRDEASELRSIKAMLTIRLLQARNREFLIGAAMVPAMMLYFGFSNGTYSTYLPLAIVMASLSMFVQMSKDETLKCKYAACVQGLSQQAYYLGSGIGHLAILMVVALVVIGVAASAKPEELYGAEGEKFPLFVLQVLVYPMAVLACGYALSQRGDLESNVKWVVLFLTLGATMLPYAQMLPFFAGKAALANIAFSTTIPVYTLGATINCMNEANGTATAFVGQSPSAGDYLASPCAVPLYCTPLWMLFYAIILGVLFKLNKGLGAGEPDVAPMSEKDADVIEEERRIRAICEAGGSLPSDAVLYKDLCHTYLSKVDGEIVETPAVRGVSLGIRVGECFGLLGPNGAGKTTTLAALTGELNPPSAGHVQVLGCDLSTDAGRKEAYGLLGVCPQVDPLWPTITGRDHLIFYGNIKGVSKEGLEETVDDLLTRLGLNEAADKPTETYSGGMKRKLSLAMALIGSSPLLFLDEPSAAVDAAAKRHLWNIVRARRSDQTVVMTTHSMEEAEALSDRLAIQVRGRLRCLGTPEHVKAKYGSGYQLEILLDRRGPTSAERQVKGFVNSLSMRAGTSEATLLEHHGNKLLYQLPPMNGYLTPGRVLTDVQAAKASLSIEDYSLAKPSLEQVFLRFAQEQEKLDVQEAFESSSESDVGSDAAALLLP
eukprot:TRINITY_DN30952_c0_g1_i1.p1 TRINITY_DN30952_c0_g1~~TRINITY_DN30952_c0_g1_i1.p1  ORF type:complete len:1357 (-),score=249.72 TRINITY_DN30952_c0_g1_i1:38-4018(-)